ncbi:VanZ family protein [Streptomyces sp. NRRL WC-3742]|uniref:VanZ family protein n=1 Tax=Streptomyces sp. NRRL WC-3742 TaxID=1463934 RepID=UPI0004C82DEE|nr:VanZ family protein [Streptomyces sp. NRRL WC-3742]
MTEAALNGTPLLFPVFGVLGVLLGAGAWWWARRSGRPAAVAVLWAVSLAGEAAVTLTPVRSGYSGTPYCAIGSSVWSDLTGQQGLMNIALFAPPAFLTVLLFRRPLTGLAGLVVLLGVTEVAQTLLGTGRACDAADFLDNAAGALTGTLLGVGWLLLRGRRPGRTLRDLRHGLLVGGLGLGAVGLVLVLGIRIDRGDPGFHAPPSEDIVRAQEVADGLFGPNTRVSATRTGPEAADAPPVTSVTTDRGTFRIDASTGSLLSAAADGAVTGFVLPPEQVVAAGADFAQIWFGDRITGLTPTVTPLPVSDTARTLTYHRPAGPGRPPLTLTVTVSGTGHLLSADTQAR